MPGLHIPEAPGFSGWTRLRDGQWKTKKYEEVIEMRDALAADRIACGKGVPCGDIPTHNTGFARADGSEAYTYHCRSFSRWFNPETRKMEGHAHCTCDGCF